MRYFFYLAVLAVMLSVTGCSSKTGSLTGKINQTADSIRNDGTNALNRITEDARDITDMNDTNETSANNYDNEKDITKKEYHNDLFVGDYYSQESTDTGIDSRGYESINGISEYVGDTADRIENDTARGENYVPPYGYGMVGAENIIGNDKRPKRTNDR